MVSPVILQLENVTKEFAGIPVLQQISLELQQGEFLSLLGPSGCGKTTLLRLIAGFEQPQAGTIDIAAQRVAGAGRWQPPEQRDVGMVFQDYALFPHLTVAENVAFGLRSGRPSSRLSAKEVRERVSEAIALVGLLGFERRYPHELSGGQQQRVALARALAPQPTLILLDEPLSNLDVQVRLRLRQEIRDILKSTGTTAVFVTHDQEEALSMSDRVAVLYQGRLEQFDTPEAIYHAPATRFVAEFVTQANFLPAQKNGRGWLTEIGAFAVSGSPALESADLMIRQQDLTLHEDVSGKVKVRDRQFLGREHRYFLQTPSGQMLQVVSSMYPPLPVGTRVQVSAKDTNLRLFEAAESSRLKRSLGEIGRRN